MSQPADVYLFGTCLLDLFLPEAGLDAIVLLERLGMRVHFPQQQSCCGQPAYTSGHPGEALAVARAQLACFPEDWPIVVPSGSCGGMIKHHWPRLFSGQPDEAQACAIAGRVVELTDFLLNRLNWRPQDLGEPVKVAVHTSCSARREMNVHLSSWGLLDRLANVERVAHDHESECCGFGGTFSIKHPDIAGAMVEDKARALVGSDAVEFVTADGGCLLNINGKLAQCGSVFQGRHLASFLLERTGGKP
ncbi:(Fe-S)-binding protein [Chromobacterium sphagni]|uniref:Oxidoreductase n=1 Tax=Chromobacterium sphagni TaxID=1903179 RepID=A0A1S1WVT6_9NEIS|nr:(Fe-S)-binding protein [Chromobacterium sphagni]OHX11420.1 oxidoreductase [Chromobacterium sphagni]OHX20960.1 oxidoreductase [Chromobacterium sphagni]